MLRITILILGIALLVSACSSGKSKKETSWLRERTNTVLFRGSLNLIIDKGDAKSRHCRKLVSRDLLEDDRSPTFECVVFKAGDYSNKSHYYGNQVRSKGYVVYGETELGFFRARKGCGRISFVPHSNFSEDDVEDYYDPLDGFDPKANKDKKYKKRMFGYIVEFEEELYCKLDEQEEQEEEKAED